MKNKRLKYYTAAGILFTAVAGTLLHFVYEWSGSNKLIGLFAPVNESTFEHIKLLFFPMLFYSLFEAFMLHKPGLFKCRAAGTLLGSLLIPILFYSYSGILGENYLALDIITFLLSVIAAFLISSLMASKNYFAEGGNWILVILGAAVIMFFIFTYNPPSLGLFAVPMENSST